ncbi:Cyclin-D-binding Myb-like transcription factor 1 [Phlyctochytrium bullatum]|nr:Cyclin-D-binding Myb-like transcription factor 1 [Phlyctochytrium bullatum]
MSRSNPDESSHEAKTLSSTKIKKKEQHDATHPDGEVVASTSTPGVLRKKKKLKPRSNTEEAIEPSSRADGYRNADSVEENATKQTKKTKSNSKVSNPDFSEADDGDMEKPARSKKKKEKVAIPDDDSDYGLPPGRANSSITDSANRGSAGKTISKLSEPKLQSDGMKKKKKKAVSDSPTTNGIISDVESGTSAKDLSVERTNPEAKRKKKKMAKDLVNGANSESEYQQPDHHDSGAEDIDGEPSNLRKPKKNKKKNPAMDDVEEPPESSGGDGSKVLTKQKKNQQKTQQSATTMLESSSEATVRSLLNGSTEVAKPKKRKRHQVEEAHENAQPLTEEAPVADSHDQRLAEKPKQKKKQQNGDSGSGIEDDGGAEKPKKKKRRKSEEAVVDDNRSPSKPLQANAVGAAKPKKKKKLQREEAMENAHPTSESEPHGAAEDPVIAEKPKKGKKKQDTETTNTKAVSEPTMSNENFEISLSRSGRRNSILKTSHPEQPRSAEKKSVRFNPVELPPYQAQISTIQAAPESLEASKSRKQKKAKLLEPAEDSSHQTSVATNSDSESTSSAKPRKKAKTNSSEPAAHEDDDSIAADPVATRQKSTDPKRKKTVPKDDVTDDAGDSVEAELRPAVKKSKTKKAIKQDVDSEHEDRTSASVREAAGDESQGSSSTTPVRRKKKKQSVSGAKLMPTIKVEEEVLSADESRATLITSDSTSAKKKGKKKKKLAAEDTVVTDEGAGMSIESDTASHRPVSPLKKGKKKTTSADKAVKDDDDAENNSKQLALKAASADIANEADIPPEKKLKRKFDHEISEPDDSPEPKSVHKAVTKRGGLTDDATVAMKKKGSKETTVQRKDHGNGSAPTAVERTAKAKSGGTDKNSTAASSLGIGDSLPSGARNAGKPIKIPSSVPPAPSQTPVRALGKPIKIPTHTPPAALESSDYAEEDVVADGLASVRPFKEDGTFPLPRTLTAAEKSSIMAATEEYIKLHNISPTDVPILYRTQLPNHLPQESLISYIMQKCNLTCEKFKLQKFLKYRLKMCTESVVKSEGPNANPLHLLSTTNFGMRTLNAVAHKYPGKLPVQPLTAEDMKRPGTLTVNVRGKEARAEAEARPFDSGPFTAVERLAVARALKAFMDENCLKESDLLSIFKRRSSGEEKGDRLFKKVDVLRTILVGSGINRKLVGLQAYLFRLYGKIRNDDFGRPWTEEEDRQLIQLSRMHTERGKWAIIDKEMGRPDCIDRWLFLKARAGKDIRTGQWTADEEVRFIKYLTDELKGPPTDSSWKALAEYVGTRTVRQCRIKYASAFKGKCLKALDGERSADKYTWTPKHDKELFEWLLTLPISDECQIDWKHPTLIHKSWGTRFLKQKVTRLLANVVDRPQKTFQECVRFCLAQLAKCTKGDDDERKDDDEDEDDSSEVETTVKRPSYSDEDSSSDDNSDSDERDDDDDEDDGTDGDSEDGA